MRTEEMQAGKTILFVCSANVNRSKTAQLWFGWRNPENTYTSAGSNQYACREMGGNYITKAGLESADRIICMEKRNLREIEKQFGTGYACKTEIAGIVDKYQFLDLELIFELIDKINF